MQIELMKVSFTDAGAKYKSKAYVGTVNMKAWLDGAETGTETPVIDVDLRGLLKTGLRASVAGPEEDTVIDGDLLTDEECYKKFTDQLEPQINAAVAEYEAGLTKPQREQGIFEDTKLDSALTALEAKVNG